MAKKITVPRGTTDILPPEISLWQNIESTARKILDIYNYKEIRTPIFEEVGLFKRSLGQTTEVVNKQLLELASNKEEGFALRPEGTASIVRSYIENSIDRKESLTKFCYIGPMFRGERPQKGRLRQFHQIGAEVIGQDCGSPYIDAEVIALSVNLLKEFGLDNFKLKLNTLGSAQDREKFAAILREQLKPHRSKLSEDSQKRLDQNVFRILDSKDREDQKIIGQLEIGYDHLSTDSREYFGKVKGALDGLGVKYELSPGLVRGLDYYTHTVFEISDTSLGSQDALGAGGRYNSLVKDLGGAQVDAIGFALGIERILLALSDKKTLEQLTLNCYIIALDEVALEKGFELLNQLRAEGISADISFKLSSMKSLMRSANKSQARYVLILGEEEIKGNVVTLKNFESGQQVQVNLSNIKELAETIKNKRV